MSPAQLFIQALGLTQPWVVDNIDFDLIAQRIDFSVSCQARQLPCLGCGQANQPIHDLKQRIWRHLGFFQFAVYVHAEVPRVRFGGCKKTTQIEVPWSRLGSGFTLSFEAFALTLAKVMPVSTKARQLRSDDRALWRVLDHCITQAKVREDDSTVTVIGVDGTACGRGHHYIMLVHDLTRSNLKTAGAWCIKEALRDTFQANTGRSEAETRLKRWYSRARRCRLVPMKQLAATLKRHWAGVLKGFESGLSNGYVKAKNSLIQVVKARA